MLESSRKCFEVEMTQKLKKYCYINNIDDIDFKDPTVVGYVETYNPGIALKYYRREGMKGAAIKLISEIHPKNTNSINSKEIIKTYVCFGDYEEAKVYLQQYCAKNKAISYMEHYISIHNFILNTKTISCFDIRLIKMVIDALQKCFDADVIDLLVCYLKGKCVKCFKRCKERAFKEIMPVLTIEYIENLCYNDLYYLYKNFAPKFIFLKRMILINPYIEEKLYREYVKTEGIKEEDIDRILNTVYKDWAFKIAYEKGWIKDSMRYIIESALEGPKIIDINDKWGNLEE